MIIFCLKLLLQWWLPNSHFYFYFLNIFLFLIPYIKYNIISVSGVQDREWTFILLPRDHPSKSSTPWQHTHLLQYCWLYFLHCILHPHDFSITGNLYILIPSPLAPTSPTPLPSGNHQNVLYICEFDSVWFAPLFCFLDSMYTWNHIVFLFLCMTYFT